MKIANQIGAFFILSYIVSERGVYLKSFITKRVISIFVNLRYLRLKLLKYTENNKKIFDTFDHSF